MLSRSCFRIIPSSNRLFTQRSLTSASPTEDQLGVALGPEWKEHSFLCVAEATLEILAEGVSDCVFDDASRLPNADVELSQGVLTLTLGDGHGSYVLNTQTPNRQIWFSSPTSGPGRYAWHPKVRLWCSTRTRRSLADVLKNELDPIFERSVHFDFSRLHEVVDTASD